MKRWVCVLVVALVAFARPVTAQTATSATRLAWDEIGEVPSVAQADTYNLYVDNATTPVVAQNVTCAAGPTAADATCTASLPALSLGTHTLVMSQASGGAESSKSSPLSFTFVVVVTPSGLRLVSGG